MTTSYSKGLEGVIADESAICHVIGSEGRLIYCGHSIEELVKNHSFDEVAYLMLHNELPDSAALAQYRAEVSRARELPESVLAVIRALPKDQHPMEVIQCVLPLLGQQRPSDLQTERETKDDGTKISRVRDLGEQRRLALDLLAKIPTAIAAFHRHRQGLDLRESDPDMDLMTNFLALFRGTPPTKREAEVYSICAILQMEHGFNASTFTARVVGSTLSPLHTTLSAAVGALYGKLHGGADEAAFEMAKSIGSPEAVDASLDKILAAGGKVMGMGHRVYRTIDPRAKILRGLADELCSSKGGEQEKVFRTLQGVEAYMSRKMAKAGKEIHPNVEFYKGPVFNALDIPPDCFTAMFVIARSFGWAAHVLELWSDHRLYRPRALYVGADT